MKRFFIAICIMIPMLAVAQQNYQIESIQGDVTLRYSNEKTWIKAKKLMDVSLDDILNVKKGGSVSVLEKSTGRVYVSTETGQVSVLVRLQNRDKKEQSVFSALFSETTRNTKQQESPNLYISYSASTNGVRKTYIPTASGSAMPDTNNVNTDLYDSVYTSILQLIQNKKTEEANDLVVEKDSGSDGTFTITITNNSDRLLYFNAVHITDGHPAICYYIDDMDFIPLQFGTTVDLTAFPLIQDQGQYILIASDVNLSVELLEATFESEPILSSCELECIKLKRL